jgi:hypothetical protein
LLRRAKLKLLLLMKLIKFLRRRREELQLRWLMWIALGTLIMSKI